MAIPSSGQSLSFSALRTEFVGGSSAIGLGDLYRGGSNILKKAGDNQATNLAASVATSGTLSASDFYDQAKGFTFTYSTSFLSGTSGTDQNASTLFGDDYDVNYPKNIVIPSPITLGSNNTAEYGLEIDSGGVGTITVTNNGTIMGAGGAGGSAGSAGSSGAGGAGGNGSAGGDAMKFAVDCTIVNNGSILGGGGGGAGGGGGGLGGANQQQQQTTGTLQQGPVYNKGPGPQYYWGPRTDGTAVAWNASSFPYNASTGAPNNLPYSTTQFSSGQYTYKRGPSRPSDYSIFRTYPGPIQQQQQTAGEAGGAGGAGGLGRGFNNQPGGDAGASGSAGGSSTPGGNGGTGGDGGTGGGFGSDGGSGNAGGAGTNSSTSGSAGGSAGSVGSAGAAWERGSGVTITSTNNGTITGAAPTS